MNAEQTSDIKDNRHNETSDETGRNSSPKEPIKRNYFWFDAPVILVEHGESMWNLPNRCEQIPRNAFTTTGTK